MYYPFVRPITEEHYTQKNWNPDKYKMKKKTTESVIIYGFCLIHWNAAVIYNISGVDYFGPCRNGDLELAIKD